MFLKTSATELLDKTAHLKAKVPPVEILLARPFNLGDMAMYAQNYSLNLCLAITSVMIPRSLSHVKIDARRTDKAELSIVTGFFDEGTRWFVLGLPYCRGL